jgi:hypothetical protein
MQKLTIALIIIVVVMVGFTGYLFGVMNTGNYSLNMTNKSNDSQVDTNNSPTTSTKTTTTSKNTNKNSSKPSNKTNSSG